MSDYIKYFKTINQAIKEAENAASPLDLDEDRDDNLIDCFHFEEEEE